MRLALESPPSKRGFARFKASVEIKHKLPSTPRATNKSLRNLNSLLRE
jgi:hypothetical protein